MNKKLKNFHICVTETYSVIYNIKAECLEDALVIAEERAADDESITAPENFENRDCEEI